MPSAQKLDTHHKALTVNLDPSTFGSFAEIGAGQEVARWFLLVGGASGTVAKTISAYDKEVSDDLYGFGSRYVSKQRLEAMLDNEWTQLLTQLSKTRGQQTRFFCFVDTVSARNFAGTNDSNGWIGLRFQSQPGGPPNDVLLHVNMRMIPMSSSSKPSAFWASTLSTPHSMKCKPRNHFWKVWLKTLSRTELRSTTSICAGQHSKVGIAAPC
jgi:hypothetical protein